MTDLQKLSWAEKECLLTTGEPVVYWLEDGQRVRAALIGPDRLIVDLRSGAGPSVVGKPDWFAADYVEACGGLVVEHAPEGREPGQWSHRALTKLQAAILGSATPVDDGFHREYDDLKDRGLIDGGGGAITDIGRAALANFEAEREREIRAPLLEACRDALHLLRCMNSQHVHEAFCNGVHAPGGQCEGMHWLSETETALAKACGEESP